MKQLFTITTLFLMTFMINSCDKKTTNQIDTKQLWDCNASQNFDSTKLANSIIGNWKWTTHSSEIGGTQNADKVVTVTFTADGTFAVSENSIIVTSGNWELKIKDSNIYGLDLDNPSIYLYGRILLCDNQVLFNSSYIDGSDNLFTRIN